MKDSFWTFFIGGLIFILSISGCEDPGPVGNSLTGSETELVVDTLSIGSVESDTLNPFSGQRTYFSLGQFDDPLFGLMSASAYLRPNLPSTTSSDTLEEDANMKLRLIFDTGQVYGDSLQSGSFDIYEIDQRWRGKAWRLKDQISFDNSQTVGSFTLGEEDSLDVLLNEEWVNKYRSHFEDVSADRDSTYRENFHGLAIIPRDNSKILPLEAENTRFVIENPEADTFDVVTRHWAYSLERNENVTYPEGTEPLFSTFERVMNFDLDLAEQEFSVSNISKAEIIFYVENFEMEQSLESESTATNRPLVNNIQLHLADASEIPAGIDPGNPVAVGSYDEENKGYRFNVTSFLKAAVQNQINPNERLYVAIANNGTVKSTLFHLNDKDQPDKNPQLIVTSVKNTSTSN